MKQLLFILMLLFGAAGSTHAQVCKISNTNDNVEVFDARLKGPNQVKVVVSNDSQNISANVTVEVEVTYKRSSSGHTIVKPFKGKGLAKPNASTEIVIDIPEKIDNDYTAVSVEPKDISGTKCL